jgi:hypothetical protein
MLGADVSSGMAAWPDYFLVGEPKGYFHECLGLFRWAIA